jgi:amicyanin
VVRQKLYPQRKDIMKLTINRLPGAIAALGGLILAGCEGQVPTPAAGPTQGPSVLAAAGAETAGKSAPTADKTEVTIDNFSFNPPVLTVAVGTKVTWLNRDDVPHTVTSTTKPRIIDSPTLDSDQSFSHIFTRPGTYDYFCAVHPKMTGKIVVK